VGFSQVWAGALVAGMNDAMNHRPLVSVIIPTWNGEQWLEQLLTMLEQQTLVPDEILVIDSGSTDTTPAIARRHNVRLETIAQQDFDHGGTRTMAAGLAVGEILIYMTQNAVPASRDALKLLIEPFSKNEKVAATYGRQLANSDATLFSRHLRLFNYPEDSEIRCWADRAVFGFKTIFISNSFAAYRRDLLAAHGFFAGKLLFGEDTLTVAKLLENGYCVAYVSEACVYHSHNYSIWQDFKRYFDIGVFHSHQAGQLEKFGGPGGAGRKYVCAELSMLVAEKKYLLLPESLLRNAGKLIAYNLGKHYTIIPRCWAERLSMNRNWWLSQLDK
jgi:rhamnosyltransferase